MPESREELSMFEQMNRHDTEIKDHEVRIGALEEADRRHEEQIREIKANSLSLENTMMKESRETQDVVKRLETTVVDQNAKLYVIVNNAMGIQAKRESNDHEQKMARLKVFGDLALKVSGVILALSSAGGIIYLLLEQWFAK